MLPINIGSEPAQAERAAKFGRALIAPVEVTVNGFALGIKPG